MKFLFDISMRKANTARYKRTIDGIQISTIVPRPSFNLFSALLSNLFTFFYVTMKKKRNLTRRIEIRSSEWLCFHPRYQKNSFSLFLLGIICRRNQLRSCVPLFRIKNSNDNEGIEADFKSAECSPITLFTALPARKNRPLVICYRHLFTFDGNNYCVEKLLLIELRQKKKERGDKKLVKLNGDY